MELRVLHQHGWSISALAREFGLSRNTVKRELGSPGPRRYPERAKPTALSPAQVAHVERRLAVCPSIRGTDLHRELCDEYGYGGSYPAFQRHLRRIRPARASPRGPAAAPRRLSLRSSRASVRLGWPHDHLPVGPSTAADPPARSHLSRQPHSADAAAAGSRGS
jgi:hypothetical protein